MLAAVRIAGGYRHYAWPDVDTVGRIRLLESAGMTLPTVREFLPCSPEQRHAFEPCDELGLNLRRQIDLVDERSRNLAESPHLLADPLNTFEELTYSRSRS